MGKKQTRDFSEEKIQLHRYDNEGNVIGDLYPITKGDIVLLEDEDFFKDTVLENNLKNLYKYKIDTIVPVKTEQGTVLQIYAQGVLKNQVLLNVDDNGYLGEVLDLFERDNIPMSIRKQGMLCYVKENNKTYQLKKGITNDCWEEFGSQSGILTVQNIEDRNAIINDNRYIGMLCYVINENITYQLVDGIDNLNWKKFKAASTHIGKDEPEDKDLIWIDYKDESPDDDLIQSELFDEFRHTLSNMSDKIRDINYILDYKLDGGYFFEKEPSWDGEITDNPLKTYEDNPYKGNIKALTLKRGNKEDFLKPELTLMEGELAFCLDTEELYIGNKGAKRLLGKVGGGSGSGSGGNVTGEYIMLETPDRQYYRLYLDNSGELHIMHGDAYFATSPDVTDSARFKGLIINHVFGGGEVKKNVSPVTHSFIELYNNTDNKINLKGLSLQVAGNDEKWNVLELVGIINPRCSFLIRCSEITNKDTAYPRLIIDDYDMDWDIEIDSIGYKVYLTIGLAACEYSNPSNINGNGAKAEGYIDLLAVGGEKGQAIDGYETAYLNVGNTHTSVHRIDFKDSDNNFNDCFAIDWNEADPAIYRPRCSKDGKWDIHYDKMKLDPFRPMLINVGFGEDGNTTRTFTWQSVRTNFGYVKYKKITDSKYKIVESSRKLVVHGDIDATCHSVIVKNLTPGVYEYMVGEEGRWSDVYNFEVKAPSDSDTITFLQISDQQGFTEYEYLAWKEANKYIQENETYDFIINTGDISQNANKSYEWRYYYEFSKYNISNNMHMTCCGNNDLINKQDPAAFTYYSTYENSPMPSVYSWDYGYVHFVCLNSNINYGFTPIDDQIAWLDEHMKKVKQRAVQPRWIIGYMHESPYTIIRKKSYEKFHTAFAKYNFDLVLCGHHHMYSRSHGMGPFLEDGSDNILSWADRYERDQIQTDLEKRKIKNGGVVYVMSQATGYKLAGKVTPESDALAYWRGEYFRDSDPSYIMFTITYNKITMNAYKIINILPMETIYPDPPIKVERDNIEIIKA